MKEFLKDFSQNPVFDTVNSLTNTSFDPTNYVEDRMATEAQIEQLWNRVADLEDRINYCCRDIVVWRSYVRVIAEGSGNVLSDWTENSQIGTARRGLPFTIEFSLPHDSSKYYDNRSSKTNESNLYYANTFSIMVNAPGRSSFAYKWFYHSAVGQAGDGTAPIGEQEKRASPFASRNDGYWLWKAADTESPAGSIPVADNTPRILNVAGNTGPYPLPAMGVGSYHTTDNYYVYKDSATNKIKVDVLRHDQYAADEYLALFWIQYVQRS